MWDGEQAFVKKRLPHILNDRPWALELSGLIPMAFENDETYIFDRLLSVKVYKFPEVKSDVFQEIARGLITKDTTSSLLTTL